MSVAAVVVAAVDKRLHNVYAHTHTHRRSLAPLPHRCIATFSQCVMQIAADAVIAAHYGQANVLDKSGRAGGCGLAMPMPMPGAC